MSQYLVTCENANSCTMTTFTPPPTPVPHYAIGPPWGLYLAAAILLVAIISIAVVRWQVHAERGETDRQRIRNPPKTCPICKADI